MKYVSDLFVSVNPFVWTSLDFNKMVVRDKIVYLIIGILGLLLAVLSLTFLGVDVSGDHLLKFLGAAAVAGASITVGVLKFVKWKIVHDDKVRLQKLAKENQIGHLATKLTNAKINTFGARMGCHKVLLVSLHNSGNPINPLSLRKITIYHEHIVDHHPIREEQAFLKYNKKDYKDFEIGENVEALLHDLSAEKVMFIDVHSMPENATLRNANEPQRIKSLIFVFLGYNDKVVSGHDVLCHKDVSVRRSIR